MSPELLVSFMKNIELFKDLSNEELNLLVDITNVKKVVRGEFIYKENTPRENLFLIADGIVELVKATPAGLEKTIQIFGKHEFIGEGAMLDDYPHSTSGRVSTDATLVIVKRNDLHKLLEKQPQLVGKIFARIAGVISRRMRVTTNQVVGAAVQYMSGRTRLEHDLLGDREVPYEYYYGVQTLRGYENFNITGIPISHYPSTIVALAQVKMAAAQANHELGLMSDEVTDAIVKACEEIISGKWHTHFVVDVIQGGAGTSTNMNANEVIANRALEIMGHEKGEYQYCHPNNHVNLAQSTNDAYPTALNIGTIYESQKLIAVLKDLIASFYAKGKEFAHVIKMGRTQLQDAVPMTLGQEFEAFAVTLGEEILRLESNAKLLLEINMGATAIGTGINSDPRYRAIVTKRLAEITGLPITTAENLVEATQDTGAFVIFHAAVKRLAVKLSKICNDLRLLSSGPRCGLNEINLPPMQPGSSIMPGKVNPVIPEVVNQIAFKVIGNDLTVTLASEAGQLQLNVMEPVIAQSISESINMLINGIVTLRIKCIEGITANEDVCRAYVQNSIGLVTALNPYIGYENSTKLAKEALENKRGIYELVLEHKLMSKERLDEILTPENMIRPHTMEAVK